MKEAGAASQALSQAAELALGALERITSGIPFTSEQMKQQVAALNSYEQLAHSSQLTLPARPSFQKLLEAASAGGICANLKR